MFALSFRKDTLWLTRVKIGDEKRDRRVSKVVIYGIDINVETVFGTTSESEKPIEGRKLANCGFEFEIEFSTGNLALLSSVPIITINHSN